jgi:prepilin-type N-terminal cleavage/methylation domain-containing protein
VCFREGAYLELEGRPPLNLIGETTMTKSNNGFTLVEMLVVIAIIALLASALFPAITGAMDSAKATALKNKGRGIWTAVTTANNERTVLNRSALWPANYTNGIGSASSAGYQTWLLSEGGKSSAGKIAESKEDQLVPDLDPTSFIASGITAANRGSSIDEENTAWRVCNISDNDSAEVPFLVTKNLSTNVKEFKHSSSEDGSDENRYELDPGVEPFGAKRAVWVTHGGSCSDASKKYFTDYQVMGYNSKPQTVEVWPAK